MLARYGVDFLDDLISDDLEIAEHAASEFSDILYSQGDIYPESLAAVQHLALALESATPPVQVAFIYLLGGIAKADNVPNGDLY